MEEKTVKFDLSADKLLDIAEARIDGGDAIGALRMLHKSLALYGPGADEYADLAEAYDDLEIFDLAANNWFRFLDVCEADERVDAYEGLAACYYNLGNEARAMYYYEQMLHDKYVTPSNNFEMGEMFSHPPRKPFRVTWPPERADYSEEVDAGLRALKSGEFDVAEEKFRAVPERSPYRNAAMNFLAVSYLLQGKAKAAEEICTSLLDRDPDSVQVLATYAAVLTEQDRREEGLAVAKKLASLAAESPDEMYKIATVCCENGLYEEAYEKFRILEKTVSCDLTLLYFKAVAAHKCGKVREALAGFGKILDLYPDAAVARYYFRAVRAQAEEGAPAPETAFYYRVPKEERAERVGLLAALADVSASAVRNYCKETDITELLEWCFDESDGQEPKLQVLGINVAVRGGMDEFVCDVLLDSTVSDVVKVETVQRLCERNRDFSCGVVLSDVYRRICFDRVELGRAKRSKFVAAYAVCFSRFVLFDQADGEQLRDATELLYDKLEETGGLAADLDEDSLACAIYLAGTHVNRSRAVEVLQLLGANGEKVAALMKCLHREEVAAADAADGAGKKGDGEE